MLIGSELTRLMLERGCQDIWCAVDDQSDEAAMTDQIDNDFTARIVSYSDNKFYCSAGMEWLYAVPIKVLPMTINDVAI